MYEVYVIYDKDKSKIENGKKWPIKGLELVSTVSIDSQFPKRWSTCRGYNEPVVPSRSNLPREYWPPTNVHVAMFKVKDKSLEDSLHVISNNSDENSIILPIKKSSLFH
ncbi:MAG: hypothetical protein JSW73_04545 [Candidatus Woesearchaeota archaeon]|nr:MAG: hypothetical protein JSW73_04545 [Candidatus Woesearchaeota archaeon]